MYLFVSPLRKILEGSRKSNVTNNTQIHRLPTKYTLLTIITMLASLIVLIMFRLIEGYFIISIDIMVNILCLYYMTSQWKKEYEFCCYKMENQLKVCLESAKKVVKIASKLQIFDQSSKDVLTKTANTINQ